MVYAYIFLLWALFSVLLLLSSSSSFVLWLGMELSSVFFISVLSEYLPKGLCFSMTAFKYFLVQSIGSSLIFLSLFLYNLEGFAHTFIFYVGVMVKMGFFPFHSWVFHVSTNLDLVSFFLFCTLQKVPPLLGVAFISPLESWGVVTCAVSGVFVALAVIEGLSFFHLLAVSSLVMACWAMSFSYVAGAGGVVFTLLVYAIHLGAALSSLPSSGEGSGLSALYLSTKKEGVPLHGVLWFLSLAGIPPWGMFLVKSEVGLLLLQSGEMFLLVTLLVSSAVLAFAYLKLILSFLFSSEISSVKSGWEVSCLSVLGTSFLVIWALI